MVYFNFIYCIIKYIDVKCITFIPGIPGIPGKPLGPGGPIVPGCPGSASCPRSPYNDSITDLINSA